MPEQVPPDPQSILITGAGGFVGHHLIPHIQERYPRATLYGMSRKESPEIGIKWITADLMDADSVRKAVQQTSPDWIFHLAGQACVARSWSDPAETFSANVQGQIHLFEALRTLEIKPRILVIGSSEEYGAILPSDIPVREDTPLRPMSPYAVSKVAQDLMAYQYFRSFGFQTIRTRSFNHTGPGRPDQYAASNFARQIAEIEAGLHKPVLRVGNLEAKRDYLDVRDIVRAYVLAIEKGEPGEVYNLCSGVAQPMSDILAQLLKHSNKTITIEIDPARLRPSDLPIVCGDSGRFRRLTGWMPRIPLSKTLGDLLEDWRRKVAAR